MKLWSACTLSLVLLMAAPAWPQAASTAPPSDEMRQRQRETHERLMARLQMLPGTHELSDVFELAPDDEGRLTLTSRFASQISTGMQRIQIAGWEGNSTLIVSGVRGQEGVPLSFNLSNENYEATDAFRISTSLRLSGGNLRIQRETWFEDRREQIVLIQQAARGNNPALVRLQILPGGDESSQTLEAPTFETLRRTHPAPMHEYLRPILRDLGIESLLAADPLVAWQVFSDHWQPDAQLADRVASLMRQLDANDYEQREAALLKLQEMGPTAALLASRRPADSLSAQQQSMIDILMETFRPIDSADLQRLRTDPDFLLDCLYSEDLILRQIALEQLEELLGHEVDVDIAGDTAERAQTIERLRQELPPRAESRPVPGRHAARIPPPPPALIGPDIIFELD